MTLQSNQTSHLNMLNMLQDYWSLLLSRVNHLWILVILLVSILTTVYLKLVIMYCIWSTLTKAQRETKPSGSAPVINSGHVAMSSGPGRIHVKNEEQVAKGLGWKQQHYTMAHHSSTFSHSKCHSRFQLASFRSKPNASAYPLTQSSAPV